MQDYSNARNVWVREYFAKRKKGIFLLHTIIHALLLFGDRSAVVLSAFVGRTKEKDLMQLLLTDFERMKYMLKFKDISNIDELKCYLEQKGRNHDYFYHYTSWYSLKKIYKGKSFLLTRGDSLIINDWHEALVKGAWEEWEKTYIGSFSYGYTENMAMWGLYGVPEEDAIRIAIPRKAMNDWINDISEVYLWNNKPESWTLGEIHLSDIVYVNGKSNSNDLQLTHNNHSIYTITKNGLHGIDTELRMTGYIKNYAWRYENEVRLHIHLKEKVEYEKIMVKVPVAILNTMEITTGPSFQCKRDTLYKRLKNEGKINSSSFKNMVHYRQLCSFCQNSPFVRK